jgi:excisionase family DNA binding protein
MLSVMNGDGRSQDATAVVDVETAARILGIGRGLAYRLARSGELPTLQLGRRLVVPRVQLERMLAGKAAEREAA